MLDLFLLSLAAFFAGTVDAVVGGGGLIQVPALFSVYPAAPPASLLGTNKLAGVWGTAAAAATYSRRVPLHWHAALPAAVAAFLMAFAGAYTVTHLPALFFRKLLPFILLAVAIYTFKKKDFGSLHAPVHTGIKEKIWAGAIGAGIGFYDGFFGPGTGSFLIFLFIRFFGFDFLRASAVAKVVNVACNFSALLWFGYGRHWLLQAGLIMAICNIAGAIFGTRLALRHGSVFIRKMFLLVVILLIGKTAWEAFLV